jgi:hypothetical protein
MVTDLSVSRTLIEARYPLFVTDFSLNQLLAAKCDGLIRQSDAYRGSIPVIRGGFLLKSTSTPELSDYS